MVIARLVLWYLDDRKGCEDDQEDGDDERHDDEFQANEARSTVATGLVLRGGGCGGLLGCRLA